LGLKKFVFAAKKQLIHVNDLTYDFLYEIAKELHLLVGNCPSTRAIRIHRHYRPSLRLSEIAPSKRSYLNHQRFIERSAG
jgi:hypothetical protein